MWPQMCAQVARWQILAPLDSAFQVLRPPRLRRIVLGCPPRGPWRGFPSHAGQFSHSGVRQQLFDRDANLGVSDGHPGLCELIGTDIIECPLSAELRPLVPQQPTRPARSPTSADVESPGGISPPGAPRTVREPLGSYGSRCSAVDMLKAPVDEESGMGTAYTKAR